MEGTPFGRYRLIELLGRGGMGEVWRAHDTITDRVVAIKVLPANLSEDRDFQQRFRREAHAAARLETPHVVPIYDYGEIDGRLFVSMRLIKGRDLAAVLAGGPLEPARAVRIVGQVAEALHAAHEIGLIHRDIKPSNILLDDHDFAYLIDFGIARMLGETRMTQTGSAVGTFNYIAPERLAMGADEDARADIYSLACVLHECLTGGPPFPGETMPQLVAAHLSAPPPRPSIARPDIPAQVDAVIAKGMAKEPDQRYATTVELARDALDAITPPSPRPAAPGAPVQFGPTERVTPPGLRQQHRSTAAQMSQNDPTQHRPATDLDLGATPVPGAPRVAAPGSVWKRHRAAAAGAIAVVAVLAIVASIIVVRISMAGDSGTVPHDGGSAAPNAPALTGTFTVDFGPQLNSAGNPQGGPPSPKATWHLRSGCGANGCIANAINDNDPLGARVFDYVDGRWLSVTNRPAKCKGHDGQEWNIISLQPTRDGTLSGEFFLQNSMECYAKGTVTFTRTGDTDDGQLRDPGNQPRRVVSPAEALHGSYHTTATFEGDSQKHEADFTVRTYCMRTGDSCISYFYRAEGETDPLVFTDGRWLLVKNFDYTPGGSCGPEARGHIDGTREFPLPQPLQNPMTLLTGYGSFKATGPSCVRPQQYGTGQKFERTGE